MASASTGILVIVPRLSKMTIHHPCRMDINSPELAQKVFEHVIGKHCVPGNIFTDRGTQFNSRFWNSVCSNTSIHHCRSTAFYHQTHGQTEGQNQMIEQSL
jgi:hypothetical protein